MANLFEHTDHEGDHLSVDSWPVFNADQSVSFNYLIVKNTEDAGNDPQPGAVSVRLNAVDVNRLHAALGAWMADNGITAQSAITAPVADPDSLYGDLIRQAVAAEVARVLPLHLAPFAAQMQAAEGKIGRVANALLPDDPEPHDVGHRSVCALSQPIFRADDSVCSECGRRWADHPGVQAARADWLRTSRPADCDTPPPSRHPFTAVHDACGCLWEVHPRPADPEPHDVGHPVYEDARPLFAPGAKEYYEKALGITPAEDARPHPCGVCNRPWSDGHGQPGDPCRPVNTDPAPGLLGATLPVGTSHCPDCGHGWNDHTEGYCWGGVGCCLCGEKQPAPVPVTESDKVWGEHVAPPVISTVSCTGCGHRWGNHLTTGACTEDECPCAQYRSAP